jgi:hypothetical protein
MAVALQASTGNTSGTATIRADMPHCGALIAGDRRQGHHGGVRGVGRWLALVTLLVVLVAGVFWLARHESLDLASKWSEVASFVLALVVVLIPVVLKAFRWPSLKFINDEEIETDAAELAAGLHREWDREQSLPRRQDDAIPPMRLRWEMLLRALREAGARDQANALAGRAAAHATLDDPGAVARLLVRLQAPGTQNQADALAGRLPAAGLFGFIVEQPGGADQFRFGREADGRPSEPWGWEDLDL